MTSNLANLLSYVHDAERRLLATTPRTAAWLDVQRATVHARADYWNAMCQKWDLDHPRLTDSRRPLRVI
jgi:hypothetical protein